MSDESSGPKQSTKGWGVFSGTFWAALAFLGPQLAAEPLVPLIGSLHLGANAKLFVLHAVVELIVLGIILSAITFYGLRPGHIGLGKTIKASYFGWAILLLPLYYIVANIFVQIIGRIFSIDLEAPQQIGFTATQDAVELLLVFIALVIIPPIVEEIVFRGFLFKAYRRRFGFVLASVLISLLFALAHAPMVVSIDVFVLSLFLCYLREKTDSLWTPIFLHALKNFVAFAYLFIIGVN